MKVSQIAKICRQLANLDLPPDCYQDPSTDYTESQTAQLILTVANLVLEDLYCNWTTALSKAIVTSKSGIVDTQNLLLNRVVSLRDSQGTDVPFRYTERGLYVESDGTFNLLYAKLPPQVDWNEEFAVPSPRLTPSIFAYGVLAEYFHAIGDDLQMERYLAKYQEALRIATRKISPTKMPARRWLR